MLYAPIVLYQVFLHNEHFKCVNIFVQAWGLC